MKTIAPFESAVRAWLAATLAGAILAAPAAAHDDDDDELVEEVVAWGRAIDLVGAADSASEGIVGYDDLRTRPLLRVGELVEVIPGMVATQHSGGGKANQYFLRGINLDHGTDFSVHFEGMPVNMRTHGHGQGYLDINFMIPEIVRTIAYHKGTHAADVGDFSAASSAKFETYDRLDDGFVEVTWGSNEFFRAVAANSWDTAGGTWLAAAEVQYSDGPWLNPDDVERYNGFLKYTTELGGAAAEFIATWYSNDWNGTDQVPLRAVESGELDRFGYVDPTVGGSSHRLNLIANLETERTRYNLFYSAYGLDLWSNFTYFLHDPVNGDQFQQIDGRSVFGGRADHRRELSFSSRTVTFKTGLDARYDRIGDLGLRSTAARMPLSTIRDDQVDEWSIGGYAMAEIAWNDRLRTGIGLRGDFFDWQVDARRPENSGSGSEGIVNPKFTLAYTLNDNWELYANYGGGFHSNDVRAAETRVDPVTGEPIKPFDTIATARGYEAGFRTVLSERMNFSLVYFFLELDSELIFVGDAGTTEPNDATERYGFEAALFWRPTEHLTLDMTAAQTEAKFSDAPSDANRIPDAQETVASAGLTLQLDDGLTTSLRVRHFGDAPLLEDGSILKDSATMLNFGLSYPIGDFVLGLDILNLLDAEDNDIEYFYESRLANEPVGVEDRHFHPVESREFRLKVAYQF